jgi:hypothetical protein
LAATDPIADFCATPTAQADSEARQQCADYQKTLSDTNAKKTEKDAAQAAIDQINSQIKLAEQKIKIQNTIIAKLSTDIGAKTKVVNGLESDLARQTGIMTDLVRKISLRDSVSLPEIFAGNAQFSDFYIEVDQFAILNKQLVSLVTDVKASKAETETERQNLQDRKDKESDIKASIEADRRLIDRKKAEKAQILALKTSEYNVAQKILADQKQKVAQIRSRLFKFQDGEGIPFGDAYDYAVKAGKVTGVRPAFVLGILMQESSYDSSDAAFGQQVGSCYVRNQQTGDGVSVTTGSVKARVMSPSRDVPVFLEIANALGFDWQNARVSCWISAYSGGQPIGWGGAMGAAQFIPSTWKLYEKRIGSAFGIAPDQANPWNPEHAIMAASLYLGDLGAGLQTYSAEKNAACSYYSGKKCASSSAGNTYGTSVMRWVAKVQEEMIDPILGK